MKLNRGKISKALWLIAGIILIFTGILAIIYPVNMLTSITLIFGVSLVLTGIFDAIVYIFYRKNVAGSVILLVESCITALIGIFCMVNSWLSVTMLPLIFGMWIVITSICRIISSFDMKALDFKGWFWFLLLGIGGLVIGFCCMFEPVAAVIAIGIIVGVSLILQGVGALLKWFFQEKFLP